MDWLDIKEFFKDAIKYIFIIVLVFVIIMYVFTLEQVVGPSMENTLKSGDVVVLNKFIYGIKDIKRGEIISFNYADTKYLIKRVIGLPGENVKIENNKVIIDGKILKENYIGDIPVNNFYLSSLGYDKIPDDMYLVLGDNRSNSMDSRNPKVGLVKKKDIIGRVKLRVWPIKSIKIVGWGEKYGIYEI